MKCPFRTEPQALTPEELAELNERLEAAGVETYPAAEEALRSLEGLSPDPPLKLEEMHRYATHPDERVPLALLERGWVPDPEREPRPALLLYQRMQEDLDMEILWTPLADALARSGRWPEDAKRITYRGTTLTPVLRADWSQARSLESWVLAQREEAELLQLAPLHSPAIGCEVASHARVLSPAVLEAFCQHPTSWGFLLRNPCFGRPQARWLKPRAEALLVPQATPEEMSAAALTLRDLARHGGSLSRESYRRLVGCVRSSVEGQEWGAPDAALRVLLAEERLPRSILHLLFSYATERDGAKQESFRADELAESRASTPEIWQGLLAWDFARKRRKEEPFSRVARKLAREPRVAEDPETFRILASLSDPEVLAHLAEGASVSRFHALLHRLARIDAAQAARVLEGAHPEQVVGLQISDIAPLLTSENAEVRLFAIRLSGHLGGAPPSPTPGSPGR